MERGGEGRVERDGSVIEQLPLLCNSRNTVVARVTIFESFAAGHTFTIVCNN